MWSWDLILPLVLAGCVAGFMAGLLGLGGGVLVVSAMAYILHAQYPELAHLQHIAVGTSFAVMIFTGMSNALAQHRLGAVRWDMVWCIAPFMVIGTVIGSFAAPWISEKVLRIGFVVFVYLLIVKVWRQGKYEHSASEIHPHVVRVVGSCIGLLSSWLGIGGGTLSVPFLMSCRVPIRQSVGTSAVLAWPIALTGTIAYLLAGLAQTDLPSQMLGFIYLPGLLILSLCTMLFAPMGAKVASMVSARVLKVTFILLLLLIAGDMTRRLLAG